MASRLSRMVAEGVTIFFAAAFVVSAAGCVPEAVVRKEAKDFRDASRHELLLIIQENMSRLKTLQAKTDVHFIKQDVLVPAGVGAAARQKMGKSYRKDFLRTNVDGLLFLERALREPGVVGTGKYAIRNVYFHGSVMGGKGFQLLGVGEKFWITLPNPREDEPGEPKARVITGKVKADRLRSDKLISARPQDIPDLLLFDEVDAFLSGAPDLLCYRETWDEYYVLTFLRLDWREHVSSRIWIERKDLRVVIHQLFDSDGAILAEARFGQYLPHKLRGGDQTVDIPIWIWVLWPRDYTVLEMELSGVRINEEIPEGRWRQRKKPGYEVVPVERLIEGRSRGSLRLE